MLWCAEKKFWGVIQDMIWVTEEMMIMLLKVAVVNSDLVNKVKKDWGNKTAITVTKGVEQLGWRKMRWGEGGLTKNKMMIMCDSLNSFLSNHPHHHDHRSHPVLRSADASTDLHFYFCQLSTFYGMCISNTEHRHDLNSKEISGWDVRE